MREIATHLWGIDRRAGARRFCWIPVLFGRAEDEDGDERLGTASLTTITIS